MADKEKSAELILKLYDLRREETMRKARNWFFTFNPESVEDVMAVIHSEHSGFYRMVTTYWDMACSFVNHGAIDAEMFNDANAEHVFVFAKLHPILEKLRASGNPTYLSHIEKVVMQLPEAEARLVRMREMSKKVAAEMASAGVDQSQADAANA